MDKFAIQRKIFTINAVLLLVSVLALIAVIPRLLKETYPGGLPKAASIATSVGMGLHLMLFIAFLFGIRQTRRKGRINKEINIAAAVVLILFGFVIMDGAFAYVDSLRYVSIGMFLCVFCDYAAALVSISALFLLRKNKKN